VLSNENQYLKDEICKLNILIDKLNNRINVLEEENKNIKEENKIIKEENKTLNNRIDKLENNILINKIIECIQDINSINNLETVFKYPINNYLSILRNNRNKQCHYINTYDNEDVKNIKINKILHYLLNLSEHNKNHINYLCGDDNNIFIKYLEESNFKYNKNNISRTQLYYINEWWN